MALLEIQSVTRRFGDFVAVDGVSLEIGSGEFFTLLGPSGCGKTTLLRMIAGFDLPDGGRILLDGADLADRPPERRPVRTVFQSYALFPHMTVAGNVAFPLEMAKAPPDERRKRVAEALANVQLEAKADRYPHELSGGQKQRVAIARALVTHPRVLLLDEPLAALDAKLREQLSIELINLQRDVGITFVYVTHDQTEALTLSHRIAVMDHGRVEQVDEPARLYNFPRTRFVADFIGQCNLLDGSIARVEAAADGTLLDLEVPDLGTIRARADGGPVVGASGTVALRPEKIRIASRLDVAPGENRCSGHVRDLLYMGDVTMYAVEAERGKRIEALLANSASGGGKLLAAGDPVELAWRYDAGHFVAR